MVINKLCLFCLFLVTLWFLWDIGFASESKAINGFVTPPLEMELSKIEINDLLPVPR